MVILKKLFHVVTYEQKDGEYNFYLTADTEVKDSEIERILSNNYEREAVIEFFLHSLQMLITKIKSLDFTFILLAWIS